MENNHENCAESFAIRPAKYDNNQTSKMEFYL